MQARGAVPAARRARRHGAGAARRAWRSRAARWRRSPTLTSTAAEIARTRDPSPRRAPAARPTTRSPSWRARCEGMLRELDAARGETESMLARQRQFVADASHELRTPLTSVLANLELLAESLHGDQGEAARSALRSSQRMRRLVADLLLLARTDVGRVVPREPLRPRADRASRRPPSSARSSGEHEISLDVHPAVVEGVARRAAPAGDQPAGERAAPHARRAPRSASRRRRSPTGGSS